MDAREKQEEKNKRIGWLTSVSIQLVLLILFYFIVAWREPFPPIPEYGIELGFTTSAGASSAPSPQQPIEELEPDPQVAAEETVEEVQTEENTTESEEAADQEEVVTQEIEDTPVVEEQTTPQEVVEEQVEATETVSEEVVEVEEIVDERAVMQATDQETDAQDNSEGEEENQEIDERALYGSQGENTGENEGASLSLSGWIWDFKPQPNDQSSEIGKIVFEIGVDKNGELIKLKLKTSTVSRAVSLKYEEAIRKLTFSQTSAGQAPALSNGTITFIIKSK